MRASHEIRIAESVDRDRIAQLEERISRLEAHVGLSLISSASGAMVPPSALAPVFTERTTTKEEFEFEVGQHWFALAGIAILTAGVAFLLSLPYPGLPTAVPALGGLGIAVALLAVARRCPRSLPGGASYLCASAMVVLGFAALRLFFFGATQAIDMNGLVGHGILFAVIALNVSLARRRHSPWLTALALTLACGIALAVGAASLVLPSVAAAAIIVLSISRKEQSPAVLLAGLFLTHATYFAWAMGNPFLTGAVHFVREPQWAPVILLGLILLLGVAPLLRAQPRDTAPMNVAAFANCAFGYGAFLVHTAAAFPTRFAAFQLLAAVALLGLAMTFYVRTESRVSTFFLCDDRLRGTHPRHCESDARA